MRFIISALLALLATASFAADSASKLQADALDILAIIQATNSHELFPEEHNSFIATIDNAKSLAASGDSLAAEQLYSLSVLKGEILLKRINAAPPLEPEKAVFAPLSSAKPAKVTETQSPPAITSVQPEQPEEPAMEGRISERIVGGKGVYTVQKRESLKLAASRLGVRVAALARMNGIKSDAALVPGQRLKYNNRRIVPHSIRNGIVVNIPDKSLYLFRNGRVSANYPVALGIPKKNDSIIWRTPVGRFQIVDKKENPTWRIPPSIQKEMEENGEEVLTVIPPGPKNPLGKFALRTTLAGILIHSTTRPASINSYSSHGCIRVMPEHMERLFRSVSVPMQGEIVYQPIKIEKTADGRIFLEVNSDSYEKIEDMQAEVKRVINSSKLESRVSWQKVKKVLNEKSGIAEDVSLAAIPD